MVLGEAASAGAFRRYEGSVPSVKIEQLSTTSISPSGLRRWWQRMIGKPAGRVALDLALFVLGVMVVYALDFAVLSRGAPIALQYMIDLVLYLNHHAVAAVEMLY